jgi:hypothetical protein
MPLKWLFYFRHFLGIHFLCPPGDEPPPAPTPEEIAAENAALKAKIAELEKKSNPEPKPDDSDLRARAIAAAKANGDDADKIKRLENAIIFNMKSADFLKTNAALLPEDIGELFKQAEKEKFDDQAEKAASIKSGVIQSFFAVQANADLLTPGQKASLDEFLKLTKNGKQEKAQHIYEMIFEPAFERLKSERKARALNGGSNSSDADAAYRDRISQKSLKHYGMEKK